MGSTQRSSRHVVVGAGPIGSAVARQLVARGDDVVAVTRSGSGPDGTQRVAADAADKAALAAIAGGATALYNCVNPPYDRWPTEWPPIAASLLGAAERTGAVLVTVANLYGYGPARLSLGSDAYDPVHPMTEETPLAAAGTKGRVRVRMWLDALAAHEAGRVRAVEVRASDYVGPGAQSMGGDRLVPRVLTGKGVTTIGSVDRLHTWSYTEDVARLAVAVAGEPCAWGRAWHTPSHAPRTQRELAVEFARAAAVAPVRTHAIPHAVLYALGIGSSVLKELRETEYQFRDDFVMDSTAARRTFEIEPTPWAEVLEGTLRSYGWAPGGAMSGGRSRGRSTAGTR